jgi:trans-aconitate 2-methyltransferase
MTTMPRTDPWDGQEYARHSSMQYRQAREALQRLDLAGFRRILDIGCGNGDITEHLSEQAAGGQVIGIDVSPSMIELARRSYATPDQLEFRHASADALEFDEEFDLVCSFSTMHWVTRQWATWSGIHRALRKPGRVVVGFQADQEELWEAVHAVIQRDAWSRHMDGLHETYNHWTREFMTRCIRASGFYIDRFDEIIGDESFDTRRALADFLISWMPVVRHLPEHARERLRQEILDDYYQRADPELVRSAGLRVKRYIIQAWKR